jgi:hypothetical protein
MNPNAKPAPRAHVPPLVFLRRRLFGLEAYFKPCSGRFGVFLQRARREHVAPAFQARDNGLRCLHALRDLLLREAGLGASLDQGGGMRELPFQSVVFAPVLGVLHPLLVEIVNSRAFSSILYLPGSRRPLAVT